MSIPLPAYNFSCSRFVPANQIRPPLLAGLVQTEGDRRDYEHGYNG